MGFQCKVDTLASLLNISVQKIQCSYKSILTSTDYTSKAKSPSRVRVTTRSCQTKVRTKKLKFVVLSVLERNALLKRRRLLNYNLKKSG